MPPNPYTLSTCDEPPTREDRLRTVGMTAAKAVVDGLYEAAALLDTKLRITAHNGAFALLASASPDELQLMSGTPFDLFRDEDGKTAVAARTALKEGRPIHLAEQRVVNLDEEALIVWFSFIPLFGPTGEVTELLQVMRDVTAEANAHLKLKHLLVQAKARTQSLEEAVVLRTEELSRALEHVTRLSRTDPLTGLVNRRAITEQVHRAIDAGRRHNQTVALLMCDLDGFKRLNDGFGHQAGDDVLVKVADTLQRCVRQCDLVGRFGGEEFLILLPDTTIHDLPEIGARINQAVRALDITSVLPGVDHPITISIGMAAFPDHGTNFDELLLRADQAMYFAKESGKDQCALFASDTCTGGSDPTALRILTVGVGREPEAPDHEFVPGLAVIVRAPTRRAANALLAGATFDALVVAGTLPDGSGLDFFSRLDLPPVTLRILGLEEPSALLDIEELNRAGIDRLIRVSDDSRTLASTVRKLLDGASARARVQRSRPRSSGSTIDAILATNEPLAFHFQPLHDGSTGSIVGHEALCRPPPWLAPSPVDLFDGAVRAGDIWRLGRHCRKRIADMIVGHPLGLLFLNIHPAELEDPQLGREDASLRGIADRVVFEVTERAAITDFDRVNERMRELRSCGYRFAVDDLGSGFASLQSLVLLHPDFVKIDMSIIRGLTDTSPSFDLVRHIAEICRDQNIKVVAEGIECEEEAELARRAGCDLLQGYHLGRPEPLSSAG